MIADVAAWFRAPRRFHRNDGGTIGLLFIPPRFCCSLVAMILAGVAVSFCAYHFAKYFIRSAKSGCCKIWPIWGGKTCVLFIVVLCVPVLLVDLVVSQMFYGYVFSMWIPSRSGWSLSAGGGRVGSFGSWTPWGSINLGLVINQKLFEMKKSITP